MGLPWSSIGKESDLRRRGHWFDPWSGKIPHAIGQQSQCTTTTEPMCCKARALQQEKPPQREGLAPQLEKAHVQH